MARPIQKDLTLTPVIRGAEFVHYENGYLSYRIWVDRPPNWMQSYHTYIVPYSVVKLRSGVELSSSIENYEMLDGFVDVVLMIGTVRTFDGTVQIGYQEFVRNIRKNKSPLSNPWPIRYAPVPTPTPTPTPPPPTPPPPTPTPPPRKLPTPAPPVGIMPRGRSSGGNIISQILRGKRY